MGDLAAFFGIVEGVFDQLVVGMYRPRSGLTQSPLECQPDHHDCHAYHHQIFYQADEAQRHFGVSAYAGTFQFTLVDIGRFENADGPDR